MLVKKPSEIFLHFKRVVQALNTIINFLVPLVSLFAECKSCRVAKNKGSGVKNRIVHPAKHLMSLQLSLRSLSGWLAKPPTRPPP